jgi:hypothetical protein
MIGDADIRKTKNLRVARKLLGHADIKSIMVQTAAIEDDARNALAEVHADARRPHEGLGGAAKSVMSRRLTD